MDDDNDTQFLECTQVIPDFDATDSPESGPCIVGWLEVSGIRHEIFTGESRIGRDPDACKIVLDGKTLSKQHAMIEAERDGVLLADLGSRNKTRMGRMVLRPQVRYALHGGECLKFGDVTAVYIQKPMDRDADSGSETGSESPLLFSDSIPETPLVTRTCVDMGTTSGIIESPMSIPESPALSESTPLRKKDNSVNMLSPDDLSLVKRLEGLISDDEPSFILSSQPTNCTSKYNTPVASTSSIHLTEDIFDPATPGTSNFSKRLIRELGKEEGKEEREEGKEQKRGEEEGMKEEQEKEKEGKEEEREKEKEGKEEEREKEEEARDNKDQSSFMRNKTPCIQDETPEDCTQDIMSVFGLQNSKTPQKCLKYSTSSSPGISEDSTQDIMALFGLKAQKAANTPDKAAETPDNTAKTPDNTAKTTDNAAKTAEVDMEAATQEFLDTPFRKPLAAAPKKRKSKGTSDTKGTSNDFFDAPTQDLNESNVFKSEDFLDTPTQPFCEPGTSAKVEKSPKMNEKPNVLKSTEDEILDAPTQPFCEPAKFENSPKYKAKNYENCKILNTGTSDDFLNAATQPFCNPGKPAKFENASAKLKQFEVENEDDSDDDDIFDAPTQPFMPRKSVSADSSISDDDIFNQPTQPFNPDSIKTPLKSLKSLHLLSSSPFPNLNKEVDSDDDEDFCDIFGAPTQQFSNSNRSVGSVDLMAATQDLNNVPGKLTSGNNVPGKLSQENIRKLDTTDTGKLTEKCDYNSDESTDLEDIFNQQTQPFPNRRQSIDLLAATQRVGNEINDEKNKTRSDVSDLEDSSPLPRSQLKLVLDTSTEDEGSAEPADVDAKKQLKVSSLNEDEGSTEPDLDATQVWDPEILTKGKGLKATCLPLDISTEDEGSTEPDLDATQVWNESFARKGIESKDGLPVNTPDEDKGSAEPDLDATQVWEERVVGEGKKSECGVPTEDKDKGSTEPPPDLDATQILDPEMFTSFRKNVKSPTPLSSPTTSPKTYLKSAAPKTSLTQSPTPGTSLAQCLKAPNASSNSAADSKTSLTKPAGAGTSLAQCLGDAEIGIKPSASIVQLWGGLDTAVDSEIDQDATQDIDLIPGINRSNEDLNRPKSEQHFRPTPKFKDCNSPTEGLNRPTQDLKASNRLVQMQMFQNSNSNDSDVESNCSETLLNEREEEYTQLLAQEDTIAGKLPQENNIAGKSSEKLIKKDDYNSDESTDLEDDLESKEIKTKKDLKENLNENETKTKLSGNKTSGTVNLNETETSGTVNLNETKTSGTGNLKETPSDTTASTKTSQAIDYNSDESTDMEEESGEAGSEASGRSKNNDDKKTQEKTQNEANSENYEPNESKDSPIVDIKSPQIETTLQNGETITKTGRRKQSKGNILRIQKPMNNNLTENKASREIKATENLATKSKTQTNAEKKEEKKSKREKREKEKETNSENIIIKKEKSETGDKEREKEEGEEESEKEKETNTENNETEEREEKEKESEDRDREEEEREKIKKEKESEDLGICGRIRGRRRVSREPDRYSPERETRAKNSAPTRARRVATREEKSEEQTAMENSVIWESLGARPKRGKGRGKTPPVEEQSGIIDENMPQNEENKPKRGKSRDKTPPVQTLTTKIEENRIKVEESETKNDENMAKNEETKTKRGKSRDKTPPISQSTSMIEENKPKRGKSREKTPPVQNEARGRRTRASTAGRAVITQSEWLIEKPQRTRAGKSTRKVEPLNLKRKLPVIQETGDSSINSDNDNNNAEVLNNKDNCDLKMSNNKDNNDAKIMNVSDNISKSNCSSASAILEPQIKQTNISESQSKRGANKRKNTQTKKGTQSKVQSNAKKSSCTINENTESQTQVEKTHENTEQTPKRARRSSVGGIQSCSETSGGSQRGRKKLYNVQKQIDIDISLGQNLDTSTLGQGAVKKRNTNRRSKNMDSGTSSGASIDSGVSRDLGSSLGASSVLGSSSENSRDSVSSFEASRDTSSSSGVSSGASSGTNNQSRRSRKRQSDTTVACQSDTSSPKTFRRGHSRRGSPIPLEQLSSPSQRQQRANNKPKVLFIGYKDAKDRKTVTDLGGYIEDSARVCSILVTQHFDRKYQMLSALGRGIPIVTQAWITACRMQRCFVGKPIPIHVTRFNPSPDPWDHLLQDSRAEEEFGFNLRQSLESATNIRLFEGLGIHCTPSVHPPPMHMKEIIECAGGEYLEVSPRRYGPQILVVSCQEDRPLWNSFSKLGIPLLGTEFLLTGLLRHELLLDEFIL